MNQPSVNPIKGVRALNRHAIQSNTADVLADIYQDDINISILPFARERILSIDSICAGRAELP